MVPPLIVVVPVKVFAPERICVEAPVLRMLFTPLMTPEYVVNKVWAAMKTGKAMLIMPWTVILSKIFRGILPIKLWDFVADKIFGVYKTMEDFKGRQPAVK